MRNVETTKSQFQIFVRRFDTFTFDYETFTRDEIITFNIETFTFVDNDKEKKTYDKLFATKKLNFITTCVNNLRKYKKNNTMIF